MTAMSWRRRVASVIALATIGIVGCGDNIRPTPPGLNVSVASSANTSESGGSITFTVALTSKPPRTVGVPIVSSDPSEGKPAVARLLFTPENFDAPQTVTIIGQDDFEADGAIPYKITVGATQGVDYSGLSSELALSNTDNDTSGITLSAAAGDVSEEGATTTFSAVLNAVPSAAVTLTLASQDVTEGVSTPTTLVFTPANWNAPQLVTVTGVDDNLKDGPQTFGVAVTAIASADPQYSSATLPAPVSVLCIDNDTAGFIVSDVTGPTGENGDQASFTVRLTTEPFADVTVHYASNDATEGVATSNALTFTSVNWNAPQTVTVTGQNDAVADGNQAYKIAFTATTSADVNYSPIKPADVDMLNLDDETAGMLVERGPHTTVEDGSAASFTVVLQSEPTADVVIGYASSDATEGVANGSALTFTAANWNAPQTITVVGKDDFVADGNQPYRIDFTPGVSADVNYSGMVAPSADLINIDNETAGFIIDQISTDTTENGTEAEFTIVLTSEPTANVTLHFATDDATEGTAALTSLTFTAANWDAPQTVRVKGQNDNVADGDQPYQIDFTATTSADAIYAALTPASVDFVNIDNDSAGFTVTTIADTSSEAGGQARFSVVLNSEPTADVTVNFATDDATEGRTTVTTLTFTAVNYNAPQEVVVTGQNDNVADGNQPYQIDFAATTSADAKYAALTPAGVDLTNTDDDSAGITVSLITADTTEGGGQATFTVVLTSEPTADVTVHFATDDATEGTTTLTALTFTAANYNAPQAVTVTGQNDNVADGNQRYQIDFTATTSSDAAYAAITPNSVDVINVDNDTAGITVTRVSATTTEAAGQATFTVVLNSEPTANVTVHFATDDATEGLTNGTALTFTSVNWNAAQTVTVTGQNDNVADGNQPYQVDFTATTSSDVVYAAITPVSVDLTNTDNDTAGITVSLISGDTTEAGGQATFTIVLNSEPTSNVSVNLNSDDLTEGTAAPNTITFTSANWNAPRTVTVTGVNDDVADGDQLFQVDFAATTSADAAYAAITPTSVNARNLDNDSTGITVTAISQDTSEAGTTATFSVVLDSEPTANVTVNFNSDDATEGSVGVTALTFTAVNWQVVQFVTVTGVNDAVADGTQAYQIDFTATVSADAAYAAITPNSVDVRNLDNDSAGITVSAASGDTTEAGGTATFTVVLTSEPTGNVTVNFASNDLTEGTTNVTALTFTAANWFTAQIVTVSGADDALVDGNQNYGIVFTATTSTDAAYAAITPSTVLLQNIDNDFTSCGNNILEAGEERDPPPGPFANMIVNAVSCKWQMANVPQLYCNGGCTWAGDSDCDQADADIFCKLRTGNPLSTATSFALTTALAQPGFSCPFIGTEIGPLLLRGVNQSVRYQDSSILANHGPGTVIINPVCTNP